MSSMQILGWRLSAGDGEVVYVLLLLWLWVGEC